MASTVAPRFQVLAAALLFSTGGAAIKACSLSGWQVASFRSGVAALAVLILVPSARGRWWSPRALAVGLVYAACLTLFVLANKWTTAANTIFLQSTAPLYMLLLSPWVLREPIRRNDLAFMATLAVGMAALFLGSEAPRLTAPDPARGNLLAVLSGVFWALTVVGLRWMSRGEGSQSPPAAAAVVAGNLIAFAAGLPWAFPLGGARAADWAVVGYLGVFQIALAYVSLTAALRKVPALDVALLLLLEPVLNPVWAWIVHGETPGAWSLAGGAVILAGTLMKALRG